MPPSKTALVIASRGDPIFGGLGRLAFKGFKALRGLIKGSRAAGQAIQRIPQAPGTLGRIARTGQVVLRSKTARVIAGGAVFGGASEIASRAIRGAQAPGFNVEGEFVVGPGGCPTGKVVNVAAHQRIIPLDRFGRPRRRIDVLNTKALARATRRLGGFQKRARRVEKQLARIAPRSRRRSRSKGVC